MEDEFPEDYDDDVEYDDDDYFMTDEESYEKFRKDISIDIAIKLKCPPEEVSEEMINDVERSGWSIREGSPYCLFCGCEIVKSIELMPTRKFCGQCRSKLN
jgi:hypothetical protein